MARANRYGNHTGLVNHYGPPPGRASLSHCGLVAATELTG